MLALRPLKCHPQRVLHRGAQRGQRRQIGLRIYAGMGVAGVGGQEPGQVGWRGQRRRVQHGALEVFDQPLAALGRGLVGVSGGGPKGRLALGQAVAFTRGRLAAGPCVTSKNSR